MSPALLKDPSFVARFDREIAALVCLSHPHIVTIFDRGQSAAGHVYYIMEYVEGKDGGAPIDVERLIADRCLNGQRTRELMLQVVQALGFAHHEGIIHRDVKPTNILIDRHGFAKVADFGIASMRASRATRHVTVANQPVGTAVYMSPEQQRDAASVDHRSDIYATGVMLYQMLTGELPVAGYEPPSKTVPGLSPQWDAVVAKALQQRPENRFPDMQAFESALKSIGQTSTGQPLPVSPPRMAVPPGTSRGTSVGRTPPTASQQNAVASRADVIKRAEQLFVQGQWKKAADLMAKAAGFFVGDEEITALMVQYREKANQVDEVLARMATLAQQNRWCEVSQIIAELQQSGVSVKGVEQYAAAAQQKFGALQPLVETAKTLLQQGRAAEAVAHANRALQYVADHAEALEIADTVSKRSTRRRRSRRFVVGLIAIACLAVIAVGGYLYFTESVVVEKAQRQIADREYADASRTLTDLPHRWFVEREATYLQALADLKKYASAKEIDDDALLQTSRQRLKDLFNVNEAWRTRAKSGLGEVVEQVPPDAEDTLTRGLKIATALNELRLVEPAALAEALLTKAEGRREFRSPASDATPADYVKQILEWDPTKARKVVGLALPKEVRSQNGLAAIQGWAERTPPLAGPLSAAVVQVADEHVAAGRYEEAKAFADTAKRIDLHFDTWDYWEKQFQRADGKNLRGAMKLLTFMVEGERTAERVRKATDLYSDLGKRYPGVEMTPPPEIVPEIRTRQAEQHADQFHKVIGEAEQLVKSRQYRDARAKLDEARGFSSSLWGNDAKAKELNEDVDFHLHLENAQKFYGSGDFAAALSEMDAALQVRPEDKKALDIRNKVQIAADKAEVEQHRRKAESAVKGTEEDSRGAVDEILQANEILKKPSNAGWSASHRGALDELAKTLIGKLHEQATALSEKRQYRQAEVIVARGQRLAPDDKRLSELLAKIKALKVSPESANISGTWVGQVGGNALEMALKDTGADAVAFTGRGGDQQAVGSFTRKGAVLENTSPFQDDRGVIGQLTAKARIEPHDTIVVFSWVFKPNNKKLPGWNKDPKITWTKQAAGEAVMPDDADEPGVRPPGNRPTPQKPRTRKTPTRVEDLMGPPAPDPFKSPSSSARELHSQDAPGFSAKPLKNGVVMSDLSIAIVRPITKNGDDAEITLGFRRVGSRSEGHDWMKLTVHDDRSNEYSSPGLGLDGGGGSLKGRPPSVKQLPTGFTWVSRIEVQMPGIAIGHIARIELSEGLFGGKMRSLDFQNPALPSLEFKIPAERLLSPGEKLPLDKNLVAEIGGLAVGSSPGLSLSLPMSVTNEDYNPHPCESFKLYVQSENGEVWEYSTIGEHRGWSSEDIPGKTTRKLSAALADSGLRGSLSEGLHAVLLYRSPEGILSEPRFCGFIPIPDDVRQRMKRTTNE
jgi:tetratricopeptide (TPR) repeat protein